MSEFSLAQNLYSVQGDAYAISPKEYVITDNQNFQSGAIWHNQIADLSQDFWLLYELDFGCNLSGGDGMAFVMQDVGTSLAPQGTGGNLGYNGINPSLVIEFDTFEGMLNGDPSYDHVAMNRNGDINHSSPNNLAGPFPFDFTQPDVENCTYLKMAIDWDASSNEITVYFCGLNNVFPGYSIFSQVLDIPNNIFSGNNLVTFGFTGATEFSTNLQKFKHIASNYDSFTNDTIICSGSPIVMGPIPSNFSCVWESGGSIISTQNTLNVSPSMSTNYTLTMTDDCSGIQKVESFDVVVDNSTITEITSSHVDVNCFGEANGSLEVSFSGTNPVFSINGNTPQSVGIFNNLVADNYILSATNDEGCADNTVITITEPNELDIQIDLVGNVQCNTSQTGFIEITPIGGTPIYQVEWTDENNNIFITEDLYNIDDGEFDVSIIDNNGCTFNDIIDVVQLNTITSTFISANPSCYELEDGSINTSILGGTPPYSYSWDYQGIFYSNNQNISSLGSGVYELTVTDANNCYQNYSQVLTDPDEFLASATTYDASCYQTNDGAIASSFTGGTSPYISYLLDDNQQIFNVQDSTGNLLPSQYFVYGEDINGCISDTLSLIINEPNPISIITTDLIDLECNNIPTGLISIQANGGAGVFNSYQWTGPNSYSGQGQTINELFAGDYSLTVLDNNNCSESSIITISQPSQIAIVATNIEYVKCKGSNTGLIEVNASGGTPPYNYNWTSNSNFNATGNFIDSLFEGQYTVEVIDQNNCLSSSDFTVFEPDSILQFTIDVTKSCLNEDIGTASLNITGGIPNYHIDWLGNDPTALATGQYSVLVTDDADCIVQENFTIDLFPIPEANFYVDSIVRVNSVVSPTNQSKSDISWYWNFDNNLSSVEESPIVIYEYQDYYTITLTVFNTYGCSDTTSTEIFAVNDLALYIPNSFTPNNDLKNESFKVSIMNHNTFEISIFDRFSRLLYNSDDENEGWDGTHKGKAVQNGTYVVKIYATDLFGKVFKQTKTIHLIR